jgi:hypothetical protein
MKNEGEGCQSLCAELFALCRYYSWRLSTKSAGYAANATKPNETLHFDFLYIGLSRDGGISTYYFSSMI